MGKWTNQGFVANQLEYYRTQLEQAFVTAFGDDFLLDQQLPQGVLIQELAEILYNADMDGVEVLSRLNMNTVSGIYLDLIGGLRGVPRTLGTQATLTLKVTSKPSALPYTLPADTAFTNQQTGESFVLTENKTITTEETTGVVVVCTETGTVTSEVSNTMSCSVSNVVDVVVVGVAQGAENETDADYRVRLLKTATVASGTVQNVCNLLLAMDCVKTAGVNYNDTAEVVDTIPAYCTEFMAVPVAGYDLLTFKNRVAKVICDNKTAGAPTFGNTTVTDVTDAFNQNRTIMFTIPDKIDVEINVAVTSPTTTGVMDLSESDNIKTQIATYINGLDIGKDVSYSKVLAPLTTASGFEVSSVKMRAVGSSEWITNGNLQIGSREYASCSTGNIVIGGE